VNIGFFLFEEKVLISFENKLFKVDKFIPKLV